MKTSDFDYQLPKELIAQFPAEKRDESRLMVLDRTTKSIAHRQFPDILDYLQAGDCLVINETKVFPARLWGRRIPTGGKIEVFLLSEQKEGLWEALVKPGRRAIVGTRIRFGDGSIVGKIVDRMSDGKRLVQFENEIKIGDFLDHWGDVPLPPYVHRKPVESDRERYQTVYAKTQGAVAAPTAGLHFTEQLMDDIRRKGVILVPILLHVGLGTFRPITTHDPREYPMEDEYFEIPPQSAHTINRIRSEQAKIVAVGTTTVKALESAISEDNLLQSVKGWTRTFIYPPFTFRVVDILLTNFHLPRSTLLLMVSAFADREFILEAYREAIDQKYRFYSYGDAMLIL